AETQFESAGTGTVSFHSSLSPRLQVLVSRCQQLVGRKPYHDVAGAEQPADRAGLVGQNRRWRRRVLATGSGIWMNDVCRGGELALFIRSHHEMRKILVGLLR